MSKPNTKNEWMREALRLQIIATELGIVNRGLRTEREEREKEIERLGVSEKQLLDDIKRFRQKQGDLRNDVFSAAARADSAEKALRNWALTARRLWGGGGGVHWKSFYAILDIGKGE